MEESELLSFNFDYVKSARPNARVVQKIKALQEWICSTRLEDRDEIRQYLSKLTDRLDVIHLNNLLKPRLEIKRPPSPSDDYQPEPKKQCHFARSTQFRALKQHKEVGATKQQKETAATKQQDQADVLKLQKQAHTNAKKNEATIKPITTDKSTTDKYTTNETHPVVTKSTVIDTLNTNTAQFTTHKTIMVRGRPVRIPIEPSMASRKPVMDTNKSTAVTDKFIATTSKPSVDTGKPLVAAGKPLVATGNPLVVIETPPIVTDKSLVAMKKLPIVTGKSLATTEILPIVTDESIVTDEPTSITPYILVRNSDTSAPEAIPHKKGKGPIILRAREKQPIEKQPIEKQPIEKKPKEKKPKEKKPKEKESEKAKINYFCEDWSDTAKGIGANKLLNKIIKDPKEWVHHMRRVYEKAFTGPDSILRYYEDKNIIIDEIFKAYKDYEPSRYIKEEDEGVRLEAKTKQSMLALILFKRIEEQYEDSEVARAEFDRLHKSVSKANFVNVLRRHCKQVYDFHNILGDMVILTPGVFDKLFFLQYPSADINEFVEKLKIEIPREVREFKCFDLE